MPPATPSPDLPRRAFVRRLPVLTAGFAAFSSSALSGCGGTRYLAPVAGSNGWEVALPDVEDLGEAFVQSPDMERPIFLHRDATGAWVAVLASCTHNGCQPEPIAGRLVCPCHGSEFTRGGDVLQGPAERPLERYDVEVRGNRLIVRTPGRRSRGRGA